MFFKRSKGEFRETERIMTSQDIAQDLAESLMSDSGESDRLSLAYKQTR